MSDTNVKVLPYSFDLEEPLKKTYLDTLLVTQDNEAHKFNITLLRNKVNLVLPSSTVISAYFIRYSDNATINLTGSVSGSMVSVTLKKACYNKGGQFALVIKTEIDGVVNTIFYGEGTMLVGITDTILDEENVVPSISDLLAQIAVMEEATKAANEAAGHAPYVNEANNHWMTWDTVSGKYIDTGVNATGEKGEQGDPGKDGTGSGTVTAVSFNGKTYQPNNSGVVNLGSIDDSNYAKKSDISDLATKEYADGLILFQTVNSETISVENELDAPVRVNFTVPNGYRVLTVAGVRSSGSVIPAYALYTNGQAEIWFHAPVSIPGVSVFFSMDVLFIRA